MHSLTRPFLPLIILFATALTAAASQDPQTEPIEPDRQPIGRFVLDARGAMPRFKADQVTADRIGVTLPNLPTRGLGFTLGAHAYPFRLGKVAVGVGGEILRSAGRRTLKPADQEDPDGPTVETRFTAVSPQLSLNFGHSEGWSYLSGGIGWAKVTNAVVLETAGSTTGDAIEQTRAINYGGGARWFMKRHVAFSVDVRWYAISPRPATATDPGHARLRRMVLSAGVSFK